MEENAKTRESKDAEKAVPTVYSISFLLYTFM